MKKMLCAAAMLALVAGCTTAEKDALVGGAAGAAIGGLATGKAGGALVGAAVGAAGGVLIGAATRKGECIYRNSKGQRYVAACPAGYY